MPLQKQNVSISFAEGLDTKTDPRQVVPGKLEVLQNSNFTAGMELQKRNGNSQVTTTGSSVGNGVAAYNNELISFDKYNLYSYVSEFPENLSKGFSQPIDVSSNFVYSPTIGLKANGGGFGTPTDSITHSLGYVLYTFNGNSYVITSQSSGQVVVSETSVGSSFVSIKPFVLGNYFIIVVSNVTGLIRYLPILVTTLTAGSLTTIETTSTNNAFDGVTIGSKLFISYSASGSATKIKSLDTSLTLSAAASFAIDATNIGVWADTVPATPNIWTAAWDGTNIKYFVVDTSLATVLALTSVGAVANVNNLMGASIGGIGHLSVLYYDQAATYSYSSVPSNTITSRTVTDAGVVGTAAVIQRGAAIYSKIFQMNSDANYNYFIILYGSTSTLANGFEPTYFVMSHHVYSGGTLNSAHNSPNVVAKLASGSAMPYVATPTAPTPSGVSALTSTTVRFSIGKSATNSFSSGNTKALYAINTIDLDFAEGDAYQFQNIGAVNQFTGGFLWMYDGSAPVENNFHLFPEDLLATSTPGAVTYSYIAVYAWVDAQGNTHLSAPSTAITITDDATPSIVVNIPTLRITEKTSSTTGPVYIILYRNTPSAPGGNATDIFYQVAVSANGVMTTTDSVAITDTATDASIVGNPILYTTGGVAENSGGPPSAGITIFKSRLFVIDAEDRNVLWFSKQVLETTPVEMVQNFTLFVDPRFGPMTAIAVMDDKLVIFKENAIFYITGDGPDSTGANNDFSDATFIASSAGCVDPRSVVIMQDGLMFKSNKGIYLLDRGLGVTYIGAPVESFNSSSITGSALLPLSTQVQFTLNDATSCLMYDYFYKQWSVYTNYNAASATVYSDEFTYIDPTGHIFTETPGVYSDNGTAIYQSLTTSWLSLSGLQGYQRIYRLYLLYKYISANSISVSIMYDFNTAIAQTITLDATAQNALNGTDVGQWRINIDKQKCQAIRFTITETADSNNTIGAGINIEAIGALVGSKLSYPKLPAVQAATS